MFTQTESIHVAGTATQNYSPVKSKKTTGMGHSPKANHSSPDTRNSGLWVDVDGVNTNPEAVNPQEADHPNTVGGGTDMEIRAAAVRTFAEAYNALLDMLSHRPTDEPESTRLMCGETAEALRDAVYRPVLLDEKTEQSRRVSLYEIGVAHSPNKRAAGRLTVHDKKLEQALESRETDVIALFSNSGECLPTRMREILNPVLADPAFETFCAPATRFLYQCDEISGLFL